MLAWRICRKKYASSALSGVGAELYGGRWNSPGSKMVYASSSLSLAALELFVQLDSSQTPSDLVAISFNIPDSVSRRELKVANLPRTWRRYPSPKSLHEIGSQWLEAQESLILIVPSAVNPEETNFLINPLHPESKRLGKPVRKPFRFDSRMWKK